MIEIGLTFLTALILPGLLTLCLGVYGAYRAVRLCWASFRLGYAKETLRQLELQRDSVVMPEDVGAPGLSGTIGFEGGRLVIKTDEPNPLTPYANTVRVRYTDARASDPDEFFDQNQTIEVED